MCIIKVLQNSAAGTHKIIPQLQIQQGINSTILTQGGAILAPQNVFVVATNANLGEIDSAGFISFKQYMLNNILIKPCWILHTKNIKPEIMPKQRIIV